MIKKWADCIFRWYCHPDFYPDIRGDLEELYADNLEVKGRVKAQWIYLVDVLLLFRPSLLRSIGQNSTLNNTGMLRNYFKISIRNLLKHKSYTVINVLGLAFGLTAFLLVSMYITFEKSYDRQFTGSENIYRLTTDQVINGELGVRDAMSFNPSGKALMEEIPEVIGYTTTYKFGDVVFRKGDNVKSEEWVLAADRHFLSFFDYKVLEGDTGKMAQPNMLVLTQSKAREYFGNEPAVGQEIFIHSGFDKSFQVAAVIEDTPINTHYKFNILISLPTISETLEREAWNAFNYYTYLRLIPGADLEKINPLLPDLTKKYLNENTKLVFNLQPLEDIHLYSDFTFEPELHGSARSVRFLMIISLFILLIAWVNYVNLSTARAIDRAKEVGLRKVIGAQKRQLVTQFFVESFIVNLIGAVIAFFLAELVVPYFNQMVGKNIIEHVWEHPVFLRQLLIFFLLGTVLSGFYPAFMLSGFQPVNVLKGKYRNSKSGALLRKGLVVVQFAISIALITGTLIVILQVNYMQSRDKGMNISQVVGFSLPSVSSDQWEENRQRVKNFREALLDRSEISGVALTSTLPGGGSSEIASSSGAIRIVGRTEPIEGTTYLAGMDDHMIPLLDMDILIGRNFVEDMASDSNAAIVNEAFLKKMGVDLSEDILNEKIQFGTNEENEKYPIIGVVKDANRTSLKKNVEPTIYFTDWNYGRMMVKVGGDVKTSLSVIEETWRTFFPNSPFSYTFLDDRFAQLYEEEQRFGKVFGAFSVFAILIAILGLFGLSSFMAVQRTKEVGVRKVLGASISHIIGLFYKDFLLLIGLAALFALPAVYLAMNGWLDNYAYRISFPWWSLGISLLIVVVFALITVGYQTYKVAVINPAETLKYE